MSANKKIFSFIFSIMFIIESLILCIPSFAMEKSGVVCQDITVTSLNGMCLSEEENEITVFPSSFDAREKGWVTQSKSQHGGTCAAYANASCMETSMIKEMGYDNTLDLSEKYMVKKVGYIRADALDSDMLNWKGITLEENCPTSGWDGNYGTGYEVDETLNCPEIAQIETIEILDKNSIDDIKYGIMEYGSVRFDYLLGGTNAHAVQFIGWDDNFEDETTMKGAFLSKDSRNGMVHWHYYEYGANKDAYGIRMRPADKYERFQILKPVLVNGRETVYTFTSDKDTTKKEIIRAVGFDCMTYDDNQYTGHGDFTVDFYKNCYDAEHLESGTKVHSFKRSIKRDGYYEKETDGDVEVAKGETVYIKVTGSQLRTFRVMTDLSEDESKSTVSLNTTKVNIKKNSDRPKIEASVLYSDNEKPVFTSLNKNIVNVDQDGIVTPVSAGETYISVSADNDTKYCKVSVTLPLSEATASFPECIFNGEYYYPKPVVSMNGILLKENEDYTFPTNAYKNNEFPGTATLDLIGEGKYTDSAKFEFQIKKRSIENTSLIQSTLTYNPDNEYYGIMLYGGTKMAYSDLCESYLLNNEVGKQTLQVKGNGYLYGETTYPVNITALAPSRVSVTLSDNMAIRYHSYQNGTYIYTGKEVRPEVRVTVTVKGKEIELPKTEYEVTYENNIERYVKGELIYSEKPSPKAVVKLNHNYIGGGSVVFNITGGNTTVEPEPVEDKDIMYAEWTDIMEYQYSPKGHTLNPTIKLNNKVLTKDKDYYISPATIYITGKSSVTVYGMGEYEGAQAKTYTIQKRTISDCSITVSDAVYNDGEKVKPVITVSCDGVTYNMDVTSEFRVTYTNNTEPGTGHVKIEGTDGFYGFVERDFTILADPKEPQDNKNISFATWTDQTELVYSPNGRTLTPIIKLNGEVLRNNIDYSISPSILYDIGTTEVYARGIGEYKNEITKTYNIAKRPIKDCEVVVKDVIYQEGNEAIPEIKISCDGYCYENNSEFTFIYSNNTTPGVGHVKISSKNFYEGYIEKDYEISLPEPLNENILKTMVKGEKNSVYENKGKYVSSNKKIVSIGKNGEITAIKEGTAVVTVSYRNKTKIYHITVEQPQIEKAVYCTKGGTKQLVLANTTQEVTWSSANPRVVTVEPDGSATAVAKGSCKVTASVHGVKYVTTVTVEAPYISKTNLTLKPMKTSTLSLAGTKQTKTYSSSNPEVVSVTDKGKLKGLAVGTSTITITCDGRTYDCNVAVQSPKFTQKTYYVLLGEEVQADVTGNAVQPEYGVTAGNIATISNDGTITGVAKGKTTITAIMNGQKITATVIVEAPYFAVQSLTLKKGKKSTIALKGTKQNITYTSSDESVATVVKGKVTGVSIGTATITAVVNGKKFTFGVTVF